MIADKKPCETTTAATQEGPQECPQTELIETAVVDRPLLAYSEASQTSDFAEQSDDDPWDDDDAWEDEYRAYAWGTVKIFAGLMAVVVVAAGWIVAIVLMSRGSSPTTDAAPPKPTPAADSPSVAPPAAQAPLPPPATATSPPATVTAPPTTVTEPPTTVTVTQTPTPVAAPPAPTAQAPSRTPDQIFLSEARAGGLTILDDSVAAADARQGCAYLAAGHTVREAQELAIRNNPSLTWRDAEVYVRAAIDAYCPQY
ncbi:DUF732 domain-containing protein [Mycobacterium heckeshornense]|uniref:DUF732 domain-containing protein n=1 Tax=Mycobacterium heckeshornense TaxID=110505 RepID=UPI0008FD36BF|nr:DUF732 domain-containing protein [Mycobacterium heckeshornense]PIJ36719.1 DUF732 domain-containing protein [Mycobacterium heckeshornense]PIJ36770.1 DUF732 domain-containing protein [Mycobacterium heckeshornense]